MPQILPQRLPLLGSQAARPSRALALTQTVETITLEARHPALHRAPVFGKQRGDLLATLARTYQQHSMQAMVVARLFRRREGRYLLRTNLTETDPAKLWRFYLQLVAVEEAFKNLKGDLAIRPVFHQLDTRIERTSSSPSLPTVSTSR